MSSVVQKGLGENARLVMVTHPILESRFFAARRADRGRSTSCARAPRAIRVIDESSREPLMPGLIERYRDRLPFAAGDPVVIAQRGLDAARARAAHLASASAPRSG